MSDILKQLDLILESRKEESPDHSYVASLYHKGLEKILKKVSEESSETIMAAKDLEYQNTQENKDHLVYEIADLWFHTMVLLASKNLSSTDITDELQRRFGLSGHDEKANRES